MSLNKRQEEKLINKVSEKFGITFYERGLITLINQVLDEPEKKKWEKWLCDYKLYHDTRYIIKLENNSTAFAFIGELNDIKQIVDTHNLTPRILNHLRGIEKAYGSLTSQEVRDFINQLEELGVE